MAVTLNTRRPACACNTMLNGPAGNGSVIKTSGGDERRGVPGRLVVSFDDDADDGGPYNDDIEETIRRFRRSKKYRDDVYDSAGMVHHPRGILKNSDSSQNVHHLHFADDDNDDHDEGPRRGGIPDFSRNTQDDSLTQKPPPELMAYTMSQEPTPKHEPTAMYEQPIMYDPIPDYGRHVRYNPSMYDLYPAPVYNTPASTATYIPGARYLY